MMNDDELHTTVETFEDDEFKDDVVPRGNYQAVIAFCKSQVRPEDSKFNGGDREIAVGYRLDVPDNLDLNGRLVSDFPYNREKNKNRGLKKWLKWLGFEPEKPNFSFDPGELVNLPVQLKIGTKSVGKGEDKHDVNVVEQVWRA